MLDLRLVERLNIEGSVQPIDKFPATIGKSKTSLPPPPYHVSIIIDNAALSKFHCSIEHSISLNYWTITDGYLGKKSTNGIWFKPQTATEMERVSSCVLQNNGDRVYLLSTKDGREVFLEVFNSTLDHIASDKDTKSLDPSVVKLKEHVQSLDVRAAENKAKIETLEDTVEIFKKAEGLIKVLNYAGSNPVQSFVGLLVLGACGITFIVGATMYVKGPDIVDAVLQSKGYKIERKQ